jgi:DNA-binding transcriptional LysR family regulator
VIGSDAQEGVCEQSIQGILPQLNPDRGNDLAGHLDFGDMEITFSALLALVAVDEFGHYGKAAKFLGKQQQGLRQHIKKLEEVLNVQLLAAGPEGEYRAVGQVGRELRDRARLMVYQYCAIGRLCDKDVKIRYLPQYGMFMSAVEARLDGLVDIQSIVLGDEDRSAARFHDNVMIPLAAGVIDFVVGPAPSADSPAAELLAAHYLYSSRQEAMVPVGDPREQIELGELVASGRLLLPPINTRSRDVLEEEIAKDVPDDPGPAVRVSREAYTSEVLIQYGIKGLGTVVLPSGMAQPFYHGNDYGGPAAANFKWIPVATSSGRLIYQEVYALVRRARDRHADQLGRILNLVRQEVAEFGLEKRADPMSV